MQKLQSWWPAPGCRSVPSPHADFAQFFQYLTRFPHYLAWSLEQCFCPITFQLVPFEWWFKNYARATLYSTVPNSTTEKCSRRQTPPKGLVTARDLQSFTFTVYKANTSLSQTLIAGSNGVLLSVYLSPRASSLFGRIVRIHARDARETRFCSQAPSI